MEELVKRLAAVREDGALAASVAELFDKRAAREEFRRPGAAEFTMDVIWGVMDYVME